MKKIFFLLAVMIASVTPSLAETYEEWVSKCTSYKDVSKWMQWNFMWDTQRSREGAALIKEGKYPKLRSPADIFTIKSGNSTDAAIFMKYSLDRINPAYRAEIISYSFRPIVGYLACSFYLDEKLHIMDYAGPSRNFHGVHGPFKDLNDFTKRHVERYLGRDGTAKYVKFDRPPWEYAESQSDQILYQIRKKVVEIEETQKALLALKEEAPKQVEEKPKQSVAISQEKEIKQAKKEEPIRQLPIFSPKIEEEKKFTSPTKEKEIPKVKDSPPAPEKQPAGIKDVEKENNIAELNERLQKAMQALKDLEEMKTKMAEQQKKEADLSARLKALEAQKIAQPKNLPVIAIANPKEGITVDSEYISLLGVAEHEKGITRFEIRVNNQPVNSKGQRDLKIVPKEQKRIEFSERIRLQEGKCYPRFNSPPLTPI